MTFNPLTEVIIKLVTLEEGLDKLQLVVDCQGAPQSEAFAYSLLEATAHLLKMGRTLEAAFTAGAWVELQRKAKNG